MDDDPTRRPLELIEAARERMDHVDVSWVGSAQNRWSMDPRALSFIGALVQLVRPAHAIEFGSGASTWLLARESAQLDPPGFVTALEHDRYYLDLTRQALTEAGLRDRVQVAFAPLVLRKQGPRRELHPAYDVSADDLQSTLPADLVVIDGPPGRLGGRAGTLFQALPLSRPGTVVVLDDAERDAEAAALAYWHECLGEAIVIRRLGGFEKGMVTIVLRDPGHP